MAMQDTMGQAAALTGGYGSSYAQNVGQQTYNQYMTGLADVIPELYQMAYSRYQDEGNALLQKYSLLAGEEEAEYNRQYQKEQEAISDYQWQAAYDYQAEQDRQAALQAAQQTAAAAAEESVLAKVDGRFRPRMNYHDLGWNTLKKLPEYINTPVMVIKSNTDPNDATFVVITSQMDAKGNPLIVAIKPNGRGKYFNLEIPTNITLSGYGKEGIQRYVAKAKTENRILYASKKNSQKNKANPSVQFADVLLSSDYTNNLANFKRIVKRQFTGTVFENSGLPQFSDRNATPTSNRSLLANALETAVQNDQERQKLQDYRAKIDQIEADEQKLSDLKKQLYEMSFAKGPRDAEYREKMSHIQNRGKDVNNVKEEMKEFAFQALSSAELLLDDLYTDDDMIRNGMGIKLNPKANALLQRAKKILYRLDKLADPAESAPAKSMDEYNREEQRLKLELSKIKTEMQIEFRRERWAQKGSIVSMVMQDLCDAYKELETSNKPYIRNAFQPFVLMHLEGIRERLKATRVEDMTLDELTEIHEAYTMVLYCSAKRPSGSRPSYSGSGQCSEGNRHRCVSEHH